VGNKNNNPIDGGSGTWQSSAGNDHGTTYTGALNAPYTSGAFAIFEAAPGTVTMDNSLGQVIASGMQFESNRYLINGGTLQLGDGGATGSIPGNVVDNATLAFDRSNTYTFGGLISGSGTLLQTPEPQSSRPTTPTLAVQQSVCRHAPDW
jgi:hypothetical protein